MTRANQTTSPPTLPTAAKTCVAGLLTAATGVLIQYLTLPEDFPTVPPGLLILAAAAAFVALRARWWWSPLVGVGVALMISIGGLLSDPGFADNLSGSVGAAGGAVVMLIGLVATITAGVAALWRHRRGRFGGSQAAGQAGARS